MLCVVVACLCVLCYVSFEICCVILVVFWYVACCWFVCQFFGVLLVVACCLLVGRFDRTACLLVVGCSVLVIGVYCLVCVVCSWFFAI